MEINELFDTLPKTPQQAKDQRLGDTVCDMEAKALVNKLAEMPLHGKLRVICQPNGQCKSQTVETLADNLQPAKKETNFNTQCKLLVEALIYTLA